MSRPGLVRSSMSVGRRLATRAIEKVSPRVAAYLDWIDPSQHSIWGGPMNGQRERQAIVRQLALAFKPSHVIETGTFRGDTTAFLADVTGAEVHTVEQSARHHHFARWRLGHRSEIHLAHGDSRLFLRRLAQDVVPQDRNVFIYLDAHWYRDIPLGGELEIILRDWQQAVVMVDDFQVPGDQGYGYDDYGPAGSLTRAILPGSFDRWRRLYPAAPSSVETGAKRGCIVLVSPSLSVTFDPNRCGLVDEGHELGPEPSEQRGRHQEDV